MTSEAFVTPATTGVAHYVCAANVLHTSLTLSSSKEKKCSVHVVICEASYCISNAGNGLRGVTVGAACLWQTVQALHHVYPVHFASWPPIGGQDAVVARGCVARSGEVRTTAQRDPAPNTPSNGAHLTLGPARIFWKWPAAAIPLGSIRLASLTSRSSIHHSSSGWHGGAMSLLNWLCLPSEMSDRNGQPQATFEALPEPSAIEHWLTPVLFPSITTSIVTKRIIEGAASARQP